VVPSNKNNRSRNNKNDNDNSGSATDAIVRSAERIRIYLSNNRRVNLALPLDQDSWRHMPHASDVIMPRDFTLGVDQPLTAEGTSNSTHVLCQLTRRNMEKLCQEEFQSLLRPLREVAIMAGALLPGDTSPTAVEAALEMEAEEEEDNLAFDAFYREENGNENDPSEDEETAALLLALDEVSVKDRKRAQQKGRKKARDVTKRERKYRQEKRSIVERTPVAESSDIKIQDGISGRPISRVVLVGGATRMPAIGRLLSVLTGVVPQKTVNPDEAVALGCAVHVGVLDGKEGMGTVLNPMQAAILRAVAEQQQKQGLPSDDFDFDDDDDDFDTVEYF
jgi:sugar (pentulose or hexulose) kinase